LLPAAALAAGVGRRLPDRVNHGLYCLGCCWALMLLLFAGGVMNLAVIVALTLWVLVEKFAPFGEWTARIGGVALLALAAWMLLA
jgi:predicted metal-binding membrane protein